MSLGVVSQQQWVQCTSQLLLKSWPAPGEEAEMSEQLKPVALPLVGHICQLPSSHGTPDLSLLIPESCQMPEALCFPCLHWKNLFVSWLSSTALCACVSPCTPHRQQQHPGVTEPAVPLPAGNWPWMSDSAVLPSYTSFYLLPWVPERGDQQPCRSRVSPAAGPRSSVGVSRLSCSRERGWRVQGPVCHSLSLQAKVGHGWQMWHSSSAFCSCPGLCTAFQGSTVKKTAQHRGRWQCRVRHPPAQQPVVVYWLYNRSPSDNCCRVASRGTPAPLPHLQGYPSPAPPEPAPAAEAAPQALLSA